jgi:hypothetical protein
MPAIGTGYSDLDPIEYRNGLPIFSSHPRAKIDGQVHIVILEEWNGPRSDMKRATKLLQEKMPSGDYVWHHEETVMINRKQGIRLVLVPRRLNSIPHNGPASWRRKALAISTRASAILKPLTKCVAVLGVLSFVFDPGEAIAAPIGGETTMGDATLDGVIQRGIAQRVQELQGIRDPKQYRTKLLELRNF